MFYTRPYLLQFENVTGVVRHCKLSPV